MARRYQQRAYDEDQLTLDFPCAITGAIEDRQLPSSLKQEPEGGHRGRPQPVTSHRSGGTARGRADQRTAREGAAGSASTLQRGRRSRSAGAHPGRAMPLQLKPSQAEPDCGNLQPAIRATPRIALKDGSGSTNGPRAPTGAAKRDVGREFVGHKRRADVKPLAEHVAELVDAAPPLSEAQRNRLAVLLRAGGAA